MLPDVPFSKAVANEPVVLSKNGLHHETGNIVGRPTVSSLLRCDAALRSYGLNAAANREIPTLRSRVKTLITHEPVVRSTPNLNHGPGNFVARLLASRFPFCDPWLRSCVRSTGRTSKTHVFRANAGPSKLTQSLSNSLGIISASRSFRKCHVFWNRTKTHKIDFQGSLELTQNYLAAPAWVYRQRHLSTTILPSFEPIGAKTAEL